MNRTALNGREKERYFILSHTSNKSKSDAEFAEWEKLCEKVGLKPPTRDYPKRALHECRLKDH